MKSGALRQRGTHVSTASLLAAAVVSLAACATTPSRRPVVRADRGESRGRPCREHHPAGEGQPADAVLRGSAAAYRRTYHDGRLSQGMDRESWQGQFCRRPTERHAIRLRAWDDLTKTLVVIKITKPVVDGADLVYSYRIISGTMPANSGATSLFIDGIGIGGSPGFHGVGLGGRGIGLR